MEAKRTARGPWCARRAMVIAVVAVLATPLPAAAQAFPDRPVRVVVPYPAGSVADVMMRVVGERLASRLGQQFIVDNRAGGGGMTATKFVADAAPDGYTLLFNGPNHVTNLGLYKHVPYDPVADFVPITHIATSNGVFVAHASTGFKELSHFVSAAKSRPGGLNYASSGSGTFSHLAVEMLQRGTGTKLTHVPYKGATPASMALGAGEVHVGISSVPLMQPLIDTKRVVPIFVTGARRLSALPDIPSLGELGLSTYDVETWFGLFAPKGTPAGITERLGQEIRTILADPAVMHRFDKAGFTTVGSSSAELGSLIRKEALRLPQLIKELGIAGG